MLPSAAPTRVSSFRRRAIVPILVLVLVFVALGLRLWQLNSVPPGLWWDEATQGLDATELLHGQFRVFYPSALGKEPLYIYLTAPFVAAWYGLPFTVRIAGALLSVLMVPALYAAGRALFPGRPLAGTWAGIVAGLFWATNFWAQSISRIGFQVNAFPLVLTTAVVAWLNYVRRPTRRRAITFGIIAGLTLYTYLAARFTPALWLVLWLLLPRSTRRSLRPSLGIVLLVIFIVALPLAIHFAFSPGDFVGRISTFSAVQGTSATGQPDPWLWSIEGTLKTFFGLLGDPIARHNLPGQASFTPLAAALFAAGLLASAVAIGFRGDQGAITVLAWWLMMCLPAILSRSSTPHYPRLFGALPAAILIGALPLGYLALALRRRWRPAATVASMSAMLVVLLVFEAGHTANAYFVEWARGTDLYTSYQQDLWTFGERVKGARGSLGVVALNEGYGKQLDYAFSNSAIYQLPATETDVSGWLDTHLGAAGGKEIISVAWGEGANLDADARQLLQHYLAREGEFLKEEPLRGFRLESFRLAEHPQFTATGRTASVGAPFETDVTLQDARWGAAYPNPDRNSDTAAAGTPIWVVLTWQLGSAQPGLRTAVDLFDTAGHRLASAEAPLMDVRQQAGQWRAGDTVQTYHLVNIPATQAPGPLVLAARMYDGKTQAPVLLEQSRPAPGDTTRSTRLLAAFGQPNVTQAAQRASPFTARPYNREFGNGLTLLGADALPATARPGETLATRLYWRVNEAATTPRSFEVTLASGPGTDGEVSGRAQVQIPAGLAVPAVIHTDVDVTLAPDATLGPQVIRLAGPAGESLELGIVDVAGRRRAWEAPPVTQEISGTFGSTVTLVGLNVPAGLSVAPGQAVTVTLIWKVLQPRATGLGRFVHVLAPDGRLIAQRSGTPCAGWDAATPDDACPSTSWLAGEILVDTVSLTVPAGTPPGRYRLGTGWYDASTLERLPSRDSEGARKADDIFPLPLELLVQ